MPFTRSLCASPLIAAATRKALAEQDRSNRERMEMIENFRKVQSTEVDARRRETVAQLSKVCHRKGDTP
jgi:hypothetical protein